MLFICRVNTKLDCVDCDWAVVGSAAIGPATVGSAVVGSFDCGCNERDGSILFIIWCDVK